MTYFSSRPVGGSALLWDFNHCQGHNFILIQQKFLSSFLTIILTFAVLRNRALVRSRLSRLIINLTLFR